MDISSVTARVAPLKKPPTIWKTRQQAFDKSRFIMTFLTIFQVTEILCSFKLVQEGKTGKEIPQSSRLVFLEKFSENFFALSDTEDNISRLLNTEGN